jgi:hypothetical protein
MSVAQCQIWNPNAQIPGAAMICHRNTACQTQVARILASSLCHYSASMDAKLKCCEGGPGPGQCLLLNISTLTTLVLQNILEPLRWDQLLNLYDKLSILTLRHLRGFSHTVWVHGSADD